MDEERLCPLPIRIVCFHYCAAAADVTVLGFFGEPGVQVLDVCTEATPHPLIITYNSTSQQHSVWAVVPAGMEVGRREEGGKGRERDGGGRGRERDGGGRGRERDGGGRGGREGGG